MWNVAWISVNPLRMRGSWEGVPLPVGVWIHLRLLWGQRVSPKEVRMRVSANCFLHKILRDDTRLILTIDGSEYSVTIPYKVLKALKAGYLSTISLEIKGTGSRCLGSKSISVGYFCCTRR